MFPNRHCVCAWGSAGILAALLGCQLAIAPVQAQEGLESPQLRDPGTEELRRQQLQRQVEEFQGFSLPEIVESAEDVSPPQPGEGPAFTVRRFDINRSEILSEDEIREILLRYVGREIHLADLYAMIGEFNALYRAAGFVTARAYIPPQKITGGMVRIVLVEGRVGRLRVEENDYIRDAYITRRLGLKEGDLVELDVLESALLRFNRLNQTKLSARLEAGAEFGQTDIVVTANEPDRYLYSLFGDNYGSLSTGHWRAGSYVRAASVVGVDDPLTVGVTRSEGSLSGFFVYEVPVTAFDTRLSVGATRTKIRVVDGPFADDPADPEVTGATTLLNVMLRQPFMLDENWLLNIDYSYNGNFSRSSFGSAVTDTRIGRHSIGVGLEYLGETGFYSLGLRAHRMRAEVSQATTIERYLGKYTADAVAYQRLGEDFAIQFTATGQVTDDYLLPAAEQFSVGGIGSMRAYEPGQFAGDEGYATQTELHYNIEPGRILTPEGYPPTRVSLYGFFDHAGAFPYRDKSADARYRREDFTNAAGLGFRISNYLGISALDIAMVQDLDFSTNNHVKRNPQFLMSLRLGL